MNYSKKTHVSTVSKWMGMLCELGTKNRFFFCTINVTLELDFTFKRFGLYRYFALTYIVTEFVMLLKFLAPEVEKFTLLCRFLVSFTNDFISPYDVF